MLKKAVHLWHRILIDCSLCIEWICILGFLKKIVFKFKYSLHPARGSDSPPGNQERSLLRLSQSGAPKWLFFFFLFVLF